MVTNLAQRDSLRNSDIHFADEAHSNDVGTAPRSSRSLRELRDRRQARIFVWRRIGRPPNNSYGRDLIRVLLALYDTENHILCAAPWLSHEELDALRREVDAGRPWSREQLGQMARLTYAEREAWRIWCMDACDVSRDEQDELMYERKKRNQREKRVKEKAMLEIARDLDDREESVETVMLTNPKHEWSTPELISALEGSRAWAGVAKTMHQAMKRVLAGLEGKGKIKSEIRPGKNGLPTRFVRLLPLAPNAQAEKTKPHNDLDRKTPVKTPRAAYLNHIHGTCGTNGLSEQNTFQSGVSKRSSIKQKVGPRAETPEARKPEVKIRGTRDVAVA
jgi:hypothetical protein